MTHPARFEDGSAASSHKDILDRLDKIDAAHVSLTNKVDCLSRKFEATIYGNGKLGMKADLEGVRAQSRIILAVVLVILAAIVGFGLNSLGKP